MPNDYFHGIRIAPQSNDVMFSAPQPGYTPIGIVAVADDADATKFPLNKAVLLRSYGSTVQSQVGTAGTLKTTLDLINSLGFFPPVVVVRVASGVDAAAQAAEVVAGLPLLATASAEWEVEPKIIGAPGLDADESVITQMGDVLESVEGFGYFALPAATDEEAETLSLNYENRRMMAIWPDFSYKGDPVSAVALALGMRSFIDATIGPHKSISNVAIPSAAIDGISALVDWQTQDSVGNTLNAAHITTLIRRNGQFFLWGSRTCNTTDDTAAFEPDVRMSDVLNGIIKANQFPSVDFPMSKSLIDDRLSQINADIDVCIKRGWLVSGRAWIDPAQNNQETVENGGLWVDYEFTVPKPLEQLGLNPKITNKYLLRVLPDWITAE